MHHRSLVFLFGVVFAARDELGHGAPVSAMVQGTANHGLVSRIAYNFENGSLVGWENGNASWVLRVADAPGDGKYLRVDYKKTHTWNYISMEVDPEMLDLHRFITMKVKGRVTLLGKLWCTEEIQQDLGKQTSLSDSKWTTLKFDKRKADRILPGKDKVTKLLLFVEPGEREGRGAFYIDDVTYSGK
jgi:hypothetical protein